MAYWRHAAEICNMALDLKAACGAVIRPDIAPRTITIRAGVHTGFAYILLPYLNYHPFKNTMYK